MITRWTVVTLFAVMLMSEVVAFGQCGELPADSACTPRVLPGTPGRHDVVMGVASAGADLTAACGYNLGHSVWFEVTPTVSGRLTFSTCDPATQYDTVVQPWRDTGDCEFPQRIDALCRDDTFDATCANGCSAYGSRVSFDVNAWETYLFEVGSYNNNAAQCNLCLGVNVTLCAGDASPPEAFLNSPATLECVCAGAPVFGTVDDAESGITKYLLEVASVGGTDWMIMGSGTNPVRDGVIAMLDIAGWPQGYYYLRLTVENGCGAVSTAVRMVWFDTTFDQINWTEPPEGGVRGGNVCLSGTVWDSWCAGSYTAEMRPFGGLFSPVDPTNPAYYSWVVNDPFAYWNTRSGLPDGNYQLRVTGTSACDHQLTVQRNVVVDNTAPIAVITDPPSCTKVDGIVPIIGTVNDAHLEFWMLQYTGGDVHSWVTIQTGQTPVINGILGFWDTNALDPCAYSLRLIASDSSIIDCNSAIRNNAEFVVNIDVGAICPVDLNGDDAEDLFDYSVFQSCFTGP